MILYVTNLSESSKAKSSDMLGLLGGLRFVLYLPCSIPEPLVRPGRISLMAPLLVEILVFGLLFLLVGLFLVVTVIDKKIGSLR